MKIERPALRYHGGKFMLGELVAGFFPPHRIYVDVFGGAANLFWHKARSYSEIYNDKADDVVNFFRVLRDRRPDLEEKIRLSPFARTDFKEAYEISDDPVERARRTAVRSFMGFGSASVSPHYTSGFRCDSKKTGSTPARDWKNYPNALAGLSERLQGVTIENQSFEELIPIHDSEETLFYVDPPYPQSTRNSRHSYKHELTDDDHRKLAAMLHQLKGMVVLSGYPCELYNELFGAWERHSTETFADGASPRLECVWLNEHCSEQLMRSTDQLKLI
jgi:DNA adenine methylase